MRQCSPTYQLHFPPDYDRVGQLQNRKKNRNPENTRKRAESRKIGNIFLYLPIFLCFLDLGAFLFCSWPTQSPPQNDEKGDPVVLRLGWAGQLREIPDFCGISTRNLFPHNAGGFVLESLNWLGGISGGSCKLTVCLAGMKLFLQMPAFGTQGV